MTERQRSLFDFSASPPSKGAVSTGQVARVVFSSPPFGPYDYAIPESILGSVHQGGRVRVPRGHSNNLAEGYCVEIVPNGSLFTPGGHALKAVREALDPVALLDPNTLELTRWMGDQYLCEWGQSIECVLPTGVRFHAGTKVVPYLHVPDSTWEQIGELNLTAKQLHVVRALREAGRPLTVAEAAVLGKCSVQMVQTLKKRGVLVAETRRVEARSHALASVPPEAQLQLNAAQQKALDAILHIVRQQAYVTFLLHGVTGSGKTEVYIRVISEVLARGGQAIVLVPEISLTPQTRQRFQSRFPDVAVLHSHLSSAERGWHWRRIAEGQAQVIVGARSAVFAPASRLGVIIIDEEHDPSFKQDTAPRYHARDVARYRAKMLNIPLILGSATPSLESWWRARNGSDQLIRLEHRVLDRSLPQVSIVDLRGGFEQRRGEGALSRQLAQSAKQVLEQKGQVLLLLNRRGFSTVIQCPACGHTVKCHQCDIALTHHRTGERAVCHYCDYEIASPQTCPECRSDQIRYSGMGTQRLETEIQRCFPGSRIQRMDSDSMKKPGSHEKVLAAFREREIDILLGTQMIAKGLDFPHVMLVGVVNADTALHLPDFRAAERTFHLVTQVAGRTGRGERGGHVFVQTRNPDHPAITLAARHDYESFANWELTSRQKFGYPPFTSMIRIVTRSDKEVEAQTCCESFAKGIIEVAALAKLEIKVVGPAAAPLAKLRGQFRFHFLMIGSDPNAMRDVVRNVRKKLVVPEGGAVAVDVDPLDMM